MPEHAIESLDDPRLEPFRDVTREAQRLASSHFIAEGENVVLRLLASEFRCPTVLCVDRKVERLRPHLQAQTQVLVAPEKLLQQIVGFKFHSGVMAVGLRAPGPSLATVVAHATGRCNLVICPDITDPANLGAILRVAAGFGATAVVLGERCRDPFVRQTVRTSMGTIFTQPVVRSERLSEDLRRLREAFGFRLFATVLDPAAEPLDRVVVGERNAILLGNEGPGLGPELAEQCDQRITIPMQRNTDSLNVAAAAAVFLYHFSR